MSLFFRAIDAKKEQQILQIKPDNLSTTDPGLNTQTQCLALMKYVAQKFAQGLVKREEMRELRDKSMAKFKLAATSDGIENTEVAKDKSPQQAAKAVKAEAKANTSNKNKKTLAGTSAVVAQETTSDAKASDEEKASSKITMGALGIMQPRDWLDPSSSDADSG